MSTGLHDPSTLIGVNVAPINGDTVGAALWIVSRPSGSAHGRMQVPVHGRGQISIVLAGQFTVQAP